MSDQGEIFKVRSYRKDCGKRIKSSKRALTWRFGLAKTSGGSVKKEEHEITLTWSVVSGKRIVLFDGKQRHFSQGMMGLMEKKFQRKWNWNGLQIEIIAHVSRPIRLVDPKWVQYDLKLNDTSFRFLPAKDEVCNSQVCSSETEKTKKNHNFDKQLKRMNRNNVDERPMLTTPPSLEKTETIDPLEVESTLDSPSTNDALHSKCSRSSIRRPTREDQNESQPPPHDQSEAENALDSPSVYDNFHFKRSEDQSATQASSFIESSDDDSCETRGDSMSTNTMPIKTISARQQGGKPLLRDESVSLVHSNLTSASNESTEDHFCSFGLKLCSFELVQVSCS